MYAIIATDSDIIDCVRKNIVDQLASSMGENITDDMQSLEYIVDDVNDNDGCYVYLGFGISPAAAKEECVHNALACGLHVDDVVHGYSLMNYFMVALVPNHDPHIGEVRCSALCFRVSLCATFAGAITAINQCELSMSK